MTEETSNWKLNQKKISTEIRKNMKYEMDHKII